MGSPNKSKKIDLVVKRIIKEELTELLFEYYNVAAAGRQEEAQRYIASNLRRDDLRELLRAGKKDKLRFVRDNFEEKFYWWADVDIERMFDNWN